VHELFEDQVRRTPDAAALSGNGRVYTYTALNRRANQVARHLRDLGVLTADRVALRMPRSVDSVVAMLAVLKAGAAYVPLEAQLPAERLRWMITDTTPRLALTGLPLTLEPGRVPVVPLRLDAIEVAGRPDDDLGVPVHPDDVCYLPYTSGSTGRPKGIEVPHRSVPGFFTGVAYATWGPGQVTLFHSSMSWDGHVFDVYPALLTGGHVVVYPGDTADPLAVARYARSHGVTGLFLPAQALNIVVDEEPDLLTGLTWLVSGGEAASGAHYERLVALAPALRLVNAYGPVECTALATAHRAGPADHDRPSVPVGVPVGDRRVYVLGDAGEAVADGTVGELCIGGHAVARGYLGRSDLTAARFVPDPFGPEPGARLYRTGDRGRRLADGVFEYLGRDDDQVKLRGFRIELGEIEAVLREHPAVAHAAAAVDPNGPAGGRLVAYLVAANSGVVDPDVLRDHLAARVPPAMVPSAFVWLDRLPITANGKLDRARLDPPPSSGHDGEPGTDFAAGPHALAVIWAQVLGVQVAAGHDDFLELGGNSLAATQMASRVRQALGVDLEVRHVYEARTLRGLAETIDRLRAVPATPAIRPRSRVPLVRRHTEPDAALPISAEAPAQEVR
jgi:amino acid adenylation domain-containing protein